MSINLISNSYPIIQQSNRLAENAARDISELSHDNIAIRSNELNSDDFKKEEVIVNKPDIEMNSDLEFNKIDFDKSSVSLSELSPLGDSYSDPLIALNQAVQYSRIGTNTLQREQDMIGSLLDVHV